MEGRCRYFQQTRQGVRCVFIGVDEWQRVRDSYIGYCRNGGAGCPILANVNRKLANGLRMGASRASRGTLE